MKILLIRFSSIGDIVLTTPVIRCLKRQYPSAELHFLVKKGFKAVIAGNPYIDQLHLLDKDMEATIAALKPIGFDYVIDMHKNLRSGRVKRALDCPSFTFNKLNIRKWLFVQLKMKALMPDKSIVDRYFEALQPIKIRNDGQGLDYFIPEQDVTKQDDLPMGHWNGFVGCVIGGSFFTKKLPVEKWQEFCRQSPYPVVLLGGPEDKAAGQLIASVSKGKVYNACGKFNINESADLVRRAKVIVSNDTGLMHVAAAFQKPLVSLWGNTTPELGMFPYYGFNNLNQSIAPQSVILENNDLSCRPCSKIGYDQCPKKHFRCMQDLEVSQMIVAVKKLWETQPLATKSV